VFTVTDIAEGKVVLDGNHPWAGKRLRFDCQILEVRAATAEEVEHGHVHVAGGHHH
jgi:FKBP-type peptidyl-prolyl cis-trans isomerase SlyD